MPSPLTNSTLQDLIKKFLKSIDNWNSTDVGLSTDTVDSNSSGEVARICLNQALHGQYALIKDSKYLEAYPTTTFKTVAGQDYIELASEASLDEVESIIDTTNNVKLIKKSWNWYRRNYLDPSLNSGNPQFYIRRNERVYFAPRPNSIVNLLTDFRKFTGDLKLNGDVCLLPTSFDFWTIAETKVKWFEMEDPESVPPLIITERNDARANALSSIFSDYDNSLQAGSSINRRSLRVGAFDRL